MKTNRILLAMSLACLCLSQAKAQDNAFVGYAPLTPAQEETTAIGSGENKYLEVAMCLDPATDPIAARLKGSEIVGVRCYLNDEYRQKSKEFSAVMVYSGTLENEVAKKITNFEKGWNEIMFDTPYVIGEEKTYISARVFELLGSPNPFASYKRADGTYYINVGKTQWEEEDDAGPIMIQAIVKTSDTTLANTASAELSYHPLSIKPDTEFECSMYIHNWSAEPLSSIELRTTSDGLDETRLIEINPAIPAFDGRVMTTTLRTGNVEDDDAEYFIGVEKTNGQTAQASAQSKEELYITQFIFTRIPVVEEFTGLTCVNCPFMAYYLDIALEEYNKPYIYIAHHAGFQDDELTTDADKELLYLFEDVTFNPAVMYDRRAFADEDASPIYGAREASHDPYFNSLKMTEQYPAEAMVVVNMEENGNTVKCTAEGKISNIALQGGENFYISTYLVEDNIGTDVYPQAGLDTPGAPADLAERFKHNGIIRHVLSNNPEGDQVTVNGNDFSITYNEFEKSDEWNWENCHIVSVVHRIDKENKRANQILNGGDSRLNEIAKSVEDTEAETGHIAVFADSSRRIRTSAPVRSMEIFNLQGYRVSDGEALQPGLYIVKCITMSGKAKVQKVAVR